jgi:hypothetical protein
LRIELVFADNFSGRWPVAELEIDPTHLKLSSVRVAPSGTAIEVQSKSGEQLFIDSAVLRALVDPKYAEETEKAFLALRGPVDELRRFAVGSQLPKD